jgi:hypothetical protein
LKALQLKPYRLDLLQAPREADFDWTVGFAQWISYRCEDEAFFVAFYGQINLCSNLTTVLMA